MQPEQTKFPITEMLEEKRDTLFELDYMSESEQYYSAYNQFNIIIPQVRTLEQQRENESQERIGELKQTLAYVGELKQQLAQAKEEERERIVGILKNINETGYIDYDILQEAIDRLSK